MTRTSSISTLAVAGFVSALLTLSPLAGALPGEKGAYIGGIYGFVLYAYFAIFRDSRSLLKGAIVTFVSAVAYLSALTATGWVYFSYTYQHPVNGDTDPPSYFAFIGGFVGAFLVCTTVLLLYSEDKKNLKWKIAYCTFGGGILGIVGQAVGYALADPTVKDKIAASAVPLYVIWQAGVAALIGAALGEQPHAEKPQLPVLKTAPPRARKPLAGPPLWGKVFLAFLLLSTFGFLVRQDWMGRTMNREHQARLDYISAHPPITNLPPIEALPQEDVVILHAIDGRAANLTLHLHQQAGYGNPERDSYTVCYSKLPQTQGTMCDSVEVTVTRFPNPEWSYYRVKGIPIVGVDVSGAHPVKQVTKFGQTICQSPGNDLNKWDYHWINGSVLIGVKSPFVNPDPIIREYLKRYPSSP